MSTITTPGHTTLHPQGGVSESAIRHFVENGFLVVEDLVDEGELQRLEADLLFLACGGYPSPSLPVADPAASDADVLAGILCIHHPQMVSPVIRDNLRHPALVAVLSRLVGAHLPYWDGSVNCLQSMYFAKTPGKPGQAWHQDEFYIPTRDRSLCGAWIAIDDATEDNGCLWVIPGSHRQGYLWPTRPPADLEEFDGSPECYSDDEGHGFDQSQAVAVPVRRGSVVFFNGYLLHRSLRNRSQRSRRALVHHYYNGWTQVPWELKAEDRAGRAVEVAHYTHRGIVPVCGSDAYADQGIDDGAHPPHLRTWGKAW